MKRRDLLGAIGIAGATAAAGNPQGLYGSPASVTGPVRAADAEALRLPLAGVKLPPETLREIERYQGLWGRVLSDPVARAVFRRDPVGYLRDQGFQHGTLAAYDQEVLLLQAVTDDVLLGVAMQGDYKGFLARLAELGVVQQKFPSGLKRKLAEAMRQNLPEIQAQARAMINGPDNDFVKQLLESRELRYLYSQLTPSLEQVAVAAVPVAIAAIVVTYVSVAVGVTVAITAGVYISIAVAVAVVASGGGGGGGCGSCHEGGRAATEGAKRSAMEAAHRAQATRLLIGKRMLALDPERLRQAQTVARAARILNNGAFVLEANRQLVRDEIAAFVEAAEEIEMIRVPPESRATVVQAMETLALRAAALA